MTRLPTILVLAIAMLLAGCFGSQRAMFPLASAAPVLGDGGRFATFEILKDGKLSPSDKYVVRKRSDGGYDFVDDKGTVTPVSFHPIPGGRHVAQVKLEKEKGYGYSVFRFAGKDATVQVPECEKQDQAKMTALGVEIRGKYECFIDKVADPAAFFAGLTYGPAISKIVKE